MEILSLIIVFVFGLLIGSFLNVVLFRFATTRSIVVARSSCMHCGKVLGVLELVPVASFVIQAGKCVGCKKPLSVQYPLVELATAITFTYFAFIHGVSMDSALLLGLLWAIGSILILIFVYDLRTKLIPDVFVFSFIVLSGLTMFVDGYGGFVTPDMYHVLAGPLFFALFYALWFLSKGRWIGFGDVKFVWGIGWLFGIGYGLSAIVLAFWVGAIVSLGLIGIGKLRGNAQLGLSSEVPFAPYLVAGIALTLVGGFDVLGLTRIFGI